MLTERKKLYYAIGCMLLFILLCLGGGIGTVRWYDMWISCHNGRSPLESLEITIDVSQQQQLIEQFNKFADKNSFKFHIIKYTPNGEEFLIDLIRKDIKVIARNPFTLGEFKVGFYNNDCIHPTVASDIDGLVSDLKNLISEIPNATIVEQ